MPSRSLSDSLFVKADQSELIGLKNEAVKSSLEDDSQEIYTITALTQEITQILENAYNLIWVRGEVTNFVHQISSGHMYFSLKDEKAQISAVMFRGQNRKLRFTPENGMQIVAMGRIGVYVPRGAYQLIVEYMNPDGAGAQQIVLEQLKRKLWEEGLFEETRKRRLPLFPQRVGIITSPQAAVWQDILRISGRRNPSIGIELYPVSVQGVHATQEIVEAIALANERKKAEVLILARGGGSAEELNAFNAEEIARAIFKSNIPIVSAIGHETDVTIADLVADVRAATPSVAAEIVFPATADLKKNILNLKEKLNQIVNIYIKKHFLIYSRTQAMLIHPAVRLQKIRLEIHLFCQRIQHFIQQHWTEAYQQLALASPEMLSRTFQNKLNILKNDTNLALFRLNKRIREALNVANYEISSGKTHLALLGPLKTLERGYTITRKINEKKEVLSSINDIIHGEKIEVIFKDGSVISKVEEKRKDPPISGLNE